jgi:deoxyribonuclease IV
LTELPASKEQEMPPTRDGKSERRELPLGAHQSIAGGTPRAVERALRAGCRVLQIFVKNNTRWVGRPIAAEEAEEFRREVRRAGLKATLAHASYLINPATGDRALHRRSTEALADELERCNHLGIPALVLHPGSHGGAGEVLGVARVARTLDEVYDRSPDRSTRILLETSAGQGTSVGHSFAHLRDILAAARCREHIGVCLDTCHVHAAGYDLVSAEGFAATLDALDRAVGLERLTAIHVNDCRKRRGSRIDRHAHIGAGFLGRAGFGHLMREPRLAAIPKYLETPKDPDFAFDRKNLALLRRLARP